MCKALICDECAAKLVRSGALRPLVEQHRGRLINTDFPFRYGPCIVCEKDGSHYLHEVRDRGYRKGEG